MLATRALGSVLDGVLMGRSASTLPGCDLIAQGILDLDREVETVDALLVSIGARRLRRLGLRIARPIPMAEQRLYRLLADRHGDAAHSRYNALVRRLVSFERAAAAPGLGNALAGERRADSTLHAGPRRGCAGRRRVLSDRWSLSVLLGWRLTTIDVDIELEPEQDELVRALPAIKEGNA